MVLNLHLGLHKVNGKIYDLCFRFYKILGIRMLLTQHGYDKTTTIDFIFFIFFICDTPIFLLLLLSHEKVIFSPTAYLKSA